MRSGSETYEQHARSGAHMSDYTEWLGPAADDLTPGQLEAFTDAADAYYALPFHAQRDRDGAIANSAEEDDYALTAILQDILMESSLMTAAHEAREAQDALTGWVRGMVARGVPEARIAEQSQLARDTVRKRIGK